MITAEQIAREKEKLPRGWGRFGTSLDHLAEIAEPGENLLAAAVGLNPTFEHRSASLVGVLHEVTQSTNVVLAVTDRRLVVLATGIGGGPREHESVPRAGLAVAGTRKRELTVSWPDGALTVRGIAKTMLPGIVAALPAVAPDTAD